jgi:hypothetical protein
MRIGSAFAIPVGDGIPSPLMSTVHRFFFSKWQYLKCILGGSIERWEDDKFRRCFEDILSGNWRQHDPYELEGRIDARTSLYGRPQQVCCVNVVNV